MEEKQNILDDYANKIMIFGSNDVFEDTVHRTLLPNFKIAALSYPDRGTFRIGLQLLDNTDLKTIKVSWWAIKPPIPGYTEESLLELTKIKIHIHPNTITLAPREKAYFTAVIEGTNNKECRWYVQEENGGQIDKNGVYEAPTRKAYMRLLLKVKYPVKKASALWWLKPNRKKKETTGVSNS